MDDVLENLTTAWVAYLNRKYGTEVSPEDIVDWSVDRFFPELSRQQVYEALMDDELWRAVRPLEDAPEVLQELIRDGHDVFVVTNSHYRALTAKMEDVLFAYFPFLTWDQVIIARNKQMVRGDILIDDGVHNLVGGDYIKILMDRPHNRSFDAEAAGMYRVSGWREIYSLITQIGTASRGVGVKIRRKQDGGE